MSKLFPPKTKEEVEECKDRGRYCSVCVWEDSCFDLTIKEKQKIWKKNYKGYRD